MFVHCFLKICNISLETSLRIDKRVAETCKYTRLTMFKIWYKIFLTVFMQFFVLSSYIINESNCSFSRHKTINEATCYQLLELSQKFPSDGRHEYYSWQRMAYSMQILAEKLTVVQFVKAFLIFLWILRVYLVFPWT